MTIPEPEIESLVDALRGDLPERKDADRVRARLVAAGAMVAGGVAAPSAAGAASLAAGSGAKAGLMSKAALLFGGSKVGLAAVIVGASTIVPLATYVVLDAVRTPASTAQRAAAVAIESRPAASAAVVTGTESEVKSQAPAPAATEASPPSGVATPRSVRPSAPAALAQKQPSELRPAESAPAVAAFPALQDSTLRAEADLVDGALSALRQGDTVRARALLQQHAQRFPRGALVRERERALQRVEQAEAARGQ